MIARRCRQGVLLSLPWLVLAAACAPAGVSGPRAPGSAPDGAPDGSSPVTLTVFAAASLRVARDALEDAWRSERPDVPLAFSFGASNVLTEQIVAGAPADVLISADPTEPAKLVAAGLAMDSPVVVATSRLVIVVPGDDPRVQHAMDLAMDGLRLVAADEGVPISRYSEEALAALARLTSDPPGFLAAVERNVVSREDNVRAALAKVELGEADAALVYETDALGSTRVRGVPLPDAAQVLVTYAAVAVGVDDVGEEARAFVTWLRGPGGGAALGTVGFGPAEPPAVTQVSP